MVFDDACVHVLLVVLLLVRTAFERFLGVDGVLNGEAKSILQIPQLW